MAYSCSGHSGQLQAVHCVLCKDHQYLRPPGTGPPMQHCPEGKTMVPVLCASIVMRLRQCRLEQLDLTAG